MDQVAAVGQIVLADAIHARFRTLAGSDQIASAFALAGLRAWLERRQPHLVLEIGGGIGATSEMLRCWAEDRPCLVVVIEDNPWCLEQWQRNVPPSLEVRLAATAPPWTWDFVVLDGPQVPPGLWQTGLAQRAVIFVEGNRRGQRQEITDAFLLARRSGCWANWRPPDRSKGFWVIQTNPTIRDRLSFFGVMLREWTRDWTARWTGRPVGKRANGLRIT